jgi:uncharacterized protein (TIGR02594 family)
MNLIETALSEYGVMEIPGAEHNPDILRYFDEIGHEWVDDDETAWCSAFVNWVAKTCGYEYSGKLNARSWLDVGDVILNFELGDIAILWRVSPDSWQGHVGFPVRKDGDTLWLLGGNQNNMVCVRPYPYSRLLGYRRLKKV